MNSRFVIIVFISVALLALCAGHKDTQTRGIGVYPGNPMENDAPVLNAKSNYRNIALRKAVLQSSAMDFNYTGQLVTDGIITESEPVYYQLFDQDGPVSIQEQFKLLDNNPSSRYNISQRSDLCYEFVINGININVDEIDFCAVTDAKVKYELEARICGEWQTLSQGNCASDKKLFCYKSPKVICADAYRVSLHADQPCDWRVNDWHFKYQGEIIPTYTTMVCNEPLNSLWVSGKGNSHWLSVDFGTVSSFDKVNLFWVERPASGSIEVSDDAVSWKQIAKLGTGSELMETIDLGGKKKGRYMRLNMESESRISLSEVQVMGQGALETVAQPQPAVSVDGRLDLKRGKWRLERASEVEASGEELSVPGFDDSSWLVATVPGTVLRSYIAAGAIPDPNYADNQLAISESYFQSDFWYRDSFYADKLEVGNRVFLNFDGINWKADVFLNGQSVGRIEGAFTSGLFDVTDVILPDDENVLAVLIHCNAHPGPATQQLQGHPDNNGGILGADNPTFHASIGWDWIPTVRGRNIGIWNDVYLTTTGPVTMSDVFVQAEPDLVDTLKAHVKVEAILTNRGDQPSKVVLKGTYGKNEFSVKAELAAGESREVSTSLDIEDAHLWWPAGYGDQYLYLVDMKVEADGAISDATSFSSGIRKMTYSIDDGILYMYVNGRRFIGRGGNWGFSESNLAYRSREYDIAAAYHKDMHFTMVRNWVGMIGDEEFYDACDRHGIMIWQDFWLANPSDGPDPDDEAMFMANANNFIRRIRNHPSIGLYCGRNEGMPPVGLDGNLRNLVNTKHPGIIYISDSADKVVSGRGPYRVQETGDYFTMEHSETFHSERGMASVMSYESLARTIPADKLWPQNDMWGLHDYTLEGAQGGSAHNAMTDRYLGASQNAQEFTSRAQMTNYNGYRAMFEGRSNHRQGLLLWMTHSCWPSMVWQSYDYYFEPHASYFGCKKANEPLHVQWNPVTRTVEVVNYSGGSHPELDVTARFCNYQGEVVSEQYCCIESLEDSTVPCTDISFPDNLTDVYYIDLKLEANNFLISHNFYIEGKNGDTSSILSLPKAEVSKKVKCTENDTEYHFDIELTNKSKTPALMLRLKAVAKDGDLILPAFWSDNYISILGGENRSIKLVVRKEDCRGSKPKIQIEGLR